MAISGELWKTYAQSLAARGYSGRAAIAELRGLGFSFGNEAFRDYYRTEVGYQKGEYYASRQPEDRAPSTSYIELSDRYISYAYTYRFTVYVWDADKREMVPQYRNIGLDSKVTIAEARQALETAIQESDTRSGGVVRIGAFSGSFQAYIHGE